MPHLTTRLPGFRRERADLVLGGDHNSEPMALTPAVEVTANHAWRWACGEQVIRPGVHGASPIREQLNFMAENRPHDSGDDLLAQLEEHRDVIRPFVRAVRA